MATTAAHTQSSRASPASMLDNASGSDSTLAAAPAPPPANPVGKKAKAKKGNADQTDAARQLQAKIAQLEQDAAGRSEEDAEIGMSSIFVLFPPFRPPIPPCPIHRRTNCRAYAHLLHCSISMR